MWLVRVLLVLLTLQLQQRCSEQKHVCPPSSCGKISNISYPFRLKDDPIHCGDKRYELSCQNNNITTLNLYSRKYHVQSINYNNLTIRVVDPGVQESNSSSFPHHFLSRSDFCDSYDYTNKLCNDPYQAQQSFDHLLFNHIIYLNCTHQVTNNSKYVNISSSFLNWDTKSKGYYIYAIAGDLLVEDFEEGCHVKFVAPTSWWGYYINQHSYDVMHKALVYGFEISWVKLSCKNICGQYESCLYSNGTIECNNFCYTMMGYGISNCGILYRMARNAREYIFGVGYGLIDIIKGTKEGLEYMTYNKVGWITGHYILPSLIGGRYLFGTTFFIALLIYKWRRRHWSMYECIETYLQQQNNLMPISYSYKQIKKMSRGFKDELGKGGFGTVFKGNLRSGPFVAIKILGKSKGNGQDFISEVTTLGRIHHLNVVRLLGFCIEGSKRALIYEFMSNGSLDKFIFSKEGSVNLSYKQIHDISIGIARGIAYLHHGCEMKILHFDIKPHNILLDENFIPKISDFGLAKLHAVDNSIVTMTAARGTIGYMAPELLYKNIGGVSYKADVYSFGMLLMEMANKRKNLNSNAEHSSQVYFPFWIYEHIGKVEEIEMENVTGEEDMKIVKKMIMVALWCIQLKPSDRPTMSKVVEMLEGDIESLEMPPKPAMYPDEVISRDETIDSDMIMSNDLINFSDSISL